MLPKPGRLCRSADCPNPQRMASGSNHGVSTAGSQLGALRVEDNSRSGFRRHTLEPCSVLHDSALASAAGGCHVGNGSRQGRSVAAHDDVGEAGVVLGNQLCSQPSASRSKEVTLYAFLQTGVSSHPPRRMSCFGNVPMSPDSGDRTHSRIRDTQHSRQTPLCSLSKTATVICSCLPHHLAQSIRTSRANPTARAAIAFSPQTARNLWMAPGKVRTSFGRLMAKSFFEKSSIRT